MCRIFPTKKKPTFQTIDADNKRNDVKSEYRIAKRVSLLDRIKRNHNHTLDREKQTQANKPRKKEQKTNHTIIYTIHTQTANYICKTTYGSHSNAERMQNGVETEHRTVEDVRCTVVRAQPKVRLQHWQFDALRRRQRRLQRIWGTIGAHSFLAHDHLLRFAQHENGIRTGHVLVDDLVEICGQHQVNDGLPCAIVFANDLLSYTLQTGIGFF